MSDATYFQDLTLFSICITAMLTVFSPFGPLSIAKDGFRRVRPNVDLLLSLGMLPPMPNTGMLNDTRTPYLDVHGDFRSYPILGFGDDVLAFVKNCMKSGYSYPELGDFNLENLDAFQSALGNHINEKYGGGVFSFLRDEAPISPFTQSPTEGGAQAPVHGEAPITEAASAVKFAVSDTVLYDWTVRIHFKKYWLDGSFAVLIFLGEVPEDPSRWSTAPTFVGSHHALVNSAVSQCDNCRQQADLVLEGFVHVDSAIAEQSGLTSFLLRLTFQKTFPI